jgi:flagellar hook-associated protein 3 FlgL
MRITTANAFDGSIANLQRRQQELADAQSKLTSGKRVAASSDDPIAAARAERALAAMVRTEAEQRALAASRNVTQLAESALGDAGELLQQARELVVNAGNASYGDADRATLADSLAAIRKQLLAVANRDDGAGNSLFGGQGSEAPPFVDAPDGVEYRGVAGSKTTASDDRLPLSAEGRRTWLGAVDPETGQADLSAFDVLDRLESELRTPGRSGEAIAQGVTGGLARLDAVMANVSARRAEAGEALARADGVETRLADTRLAAQTERSDAEDLDMVQAISDFTNHQSSYDAALKSYSLVQKLSLFAYLSA